MDYINQQPSITTDEILTTFFHFKAVPRKHSARYNGLTAANSKVLFAFFVFVPVSLAFGARGVLLLPRLYG